MYKGLYIHIPFCKRKCPYCDFYSVENIRFIEDYTSAVMRNIKAKNISADTVYFGGGTPSLMTAEQIYGILSAVSDISDNAEITMECNPCTVNEKYLSELFSAGVNRLSFGVQSLSDKELSALGRLHNSETAINAIKSAYNAGFRNISADIMLATAYQTEKTLAETIEKLSSLPINHVSAYMLKIEQGTPYYTNEKIHQLIPDEDKTSDMYLEAVSMLEKIGFIQYEISNFAQKGYESKHNLKYWRCEEYYGIGPSAHSFINGERRACPPSVESFISDDIQQEYVTDSNGGTVEERIMLGLRLTQEGISVSDIPAEKSAKLKMLEKHNLLRINNGRIILTPNGCLVSNEIIAELI